MLVAPFTFLGIELAEPAERWMQSLPKIAAEISKEIEEISSNIDAYATPPAEPVEKERSFFSWLVTMRRHLNFLHHKTIQTL